MQPSGLIHIRPILAGLFAIALIGYSFYVARNYLEGPSLQITFPENGYSTTSAAINIKGKTRRAAFITLNDRPIYVDELGNWSEIILLDPGYTIINVYIKDRFERSLNQRIIVERTSPRASPLINLASTTINNLNP